MVGVSLIFRVNGNDCFDDSCGTGDSHTGDLGGQACNSESPYNIGTRDAVSKTCSTPTSESGARLTVL